MPITVETSAAAQPKAEIRAALRPVASKNTGFLLVMDRYRACDPVPGMPVYAKPLPEKMPRDNSNMALWRNSGGPAAKFLIRVFPVHAIA
jgi:hypothetical protein